MPRGTPFFTGSSPKAPAIGTFLRVGVRLWKGPALCMTSPNDFLPPRYRNPTRIGYGGMGEIFRAEDEVLGRTVAVKVLAERYARDDSLRSRFTREALAAARLSGEPNAVTIFDVGEWHDRPFIVMEHLDGGSLEDRLQRGGAFAGRGTRLARSGGRCARCCPSARHRPSRRQAGKPPARPGRRAQGRGLRDRERSRPRLADHDRDRSRHCGLSLARAGAGGAGGRRPATGTRSESSPTSC